MEVRAQAKYIRMSPRKVRLVANMIKGLKVDEALVQLQFNKKAAGLPVAKLVKSAISNAEENNKLRRDNLFVKDITVDGGPVLKRWMPKAFGRATTIRKKMSHITLVLGELVPTATTAKKEKAADKKQDIIKVSNLEELKDLEKKDELAGNKAGAEEKSKVGKKSQKAFTNKMFNRRSGQK